MKYKYDKKNLVDAFKNLAVWAENLDAKEDEKVIDDVWNELDCFMFMIQERNPFAFGPEGCESTIMGKE
jgi:hypothetical protein